MAAMYLGRIAETGTTASVFGNPVHPYTEALLSAVPLPGVGLLPVKMVERYVADGTMQIATSLPVVENDRLFIGPRKGVEDSKAAAVEKTINRVLDGLDCLAR